MRRTLLIAPVVSFLAASPLMTGCGASTYPAAETGGPLVWRNVGGWSGRTSMQTESFLNEGGSLRIRWEARNEVAGRDGSFRVTFHSAVSGRPLTTAVDSGGTGGGSSVVAEDPRPMYVVVDATDVEWRFTLEEGFAGRSPASHP